jgi:hypothetical protein
MPNRPIIQMQGAQNTLTPNGRPIIQLNPVDQFPATKNLSFYIHDVTGSMEAAVEHGPVYTDVDVGIPRPISKDVLTTRYQQNLEYVRKQVERANLSEHTMVFSDAMEDGSRRMAGKPVKGSDVGPKTFIAFVDNEVLQKHGVNYQVQGGVSFKAGPENNPLIERVRAMMVNSGVIKAKTEAYDQMMAADNFIFVNSRRLLADAGPSSALKTTFHEIGHAFSNKAGAKDAMLSENMVRAYEEGGALGAVDSIKRTIVRSCLRRSESRIICPWYYA